MILINESDYSLERNVEDVKSSIEDIHSIGTIDFDNIRAYETYIEDLLIQLESYLLPQLQKGIDESK